MDPDAPVVFDEAELAESVHEEADTGPRGVDHIRQRLLGNGRYEGFRFVRLAEFRHQQQNSCQALLAGIEELIDEIRRNRRNRSEKACSSCSTWIISERSNPECGARGNGVQRIQRNNRSCERQAE